MAIDERRAKGRAATRAHFLRVTALGALLSAAALVAPLAGTLASPPAAGAAQLPALKSQAAQLGSQIAAESARVQSLSMQFTSESSRLAQLEVQVRGTDARLASTARKLAAVQVALRRDVVNSFVSGGVTTSIHTLVTSNNTTNAIRQQYLIAANGDMSTALDRLHAGQRRLDLERSALLAGEHHLHAAISMLGADRAALLSVVASERASLSEVNGQVLMLVNQQQQAMLASEAQIHTDPIPPGIVAAAASPPPPVLAAPAQPPQQAGTGPWGAVPAPPTPAAFAALRQCESGDNYQDDTGNGYYGAYQFSLGTWQGLGYSGLPSQAPPAVQDQAARQLQAADGWGQWPACAAQLGLD